MLWQALWLFWLALFLRKVCCFGLLCFFGNLFVVLACCDVSAGSFVVLACCVSSATSFVVVCGNVK